MQPITFTNGARIFTNSYAPTPSLGDINNDGVVDILDVSEVNSINLTDLNNDGVIDILDVAEYNSNPGGIPDVDPDPTFDFDSDFDDIINNPPVLPPIRDITFCEELSPPQTKSRVRFSNGGVSPGIITTGCNSIPNVDGVIIWPEWFENPNAVPDTFFCPPGKARGFVYNAQTGGVGYTDECTCYETDSLVSAAEVAMVFIGPLRNGAKGAAKQALSRTIATAEDSLKNAIKYKTFLEGMLKSLLDNIANYKKISESRQRTLNAMKETLRTGVNPINGRRAPPGIMEKLPKAIEDLENYLNGLAREYLNDTQNLERVTEEIKRFEGIISYFKGIVEKTKPLLDDLDHFDPAKWVSLFIGALLPISQFLVPKECGSPFVLNDECECVSEGGSGSGE